MLKVQLPNVRVSNVFAWLTIVILLVPLLWIGGSCWQRPPLTPLTQTLFQGITYQRLINTTPRPLVTHVVRIDLTAPGLKVLVTPSDPEATPKETLARTASEFLQEFGLQLAINANFFYPFQEETPWLYYPHSRDPVNVVGLAISNGITYSQGDPKWPVLCFGDDRRAQILATGECPDHTEQAVAGSIILVDQGQPLVVPATTPNNQGPYSRTVVGVDQAGTTLWLLAIDDKQLFYSEGITLTELAAWLPTLGIWQALNLDGGGSTTLVMAGKTGPMVLNAPIQTKIPMRERPLANHLGFYARSH